MLIIVDHLIIVDNVKAPERGREYIEIMTKAGTSRISLKEYAAITEKRRNAEMTTTLAQKESRDQLAELQTAIQGGGTTGRSALDYVLRRSTLDVDEELATRIEGCMEAFRGKAGSIFLLRSGVDNHPDICKRTEYVCGILNDGSEGLEAVVWNVHKPYLQINALCVGEVGENGCYWPKESPFRIDERTVEEDGEGYFNKSRELQFWMDNESVRNQLHKFGMDQDGINGLFQKLEHTYAIYTDLKRLAVTQGVDPDKYIRSVISALAVIKPKL